MKMKESLNKSEPKKRKRDDAKELVTEGIKKSKVHAQRKFAQGAAFNCSVITPIKDKVRPSSSTPSSGPMLTSKCPNTEDFLTFLCFRRTSILPPKLDFFKDALGCEQSSPVAANCKSNLEKSGGTSVLPKKSTKKNEKNISTNKSQPPTVQALRKKYQEQRLAKQKVTNVTKLAQKVKGKNMVRTRSSVAVEEPKPVTKKRISGKGCKTTLLTLRSGLKRIQSRDPKSKKSAKILKSKNIDHLRTGLRSSGSPSKVPQKLASNKTPVVSFKKNEKEKKLDEISQVSLKNVKLKKTEGFSDFSSDDSEPLLAVKKLRKDFLEVKKIGKKSPDSTKTSVRPTRKTKEAAAIYMEMLTKKLVSPDKSGEDDVSSVDSFPELPNAKRNEQRETEIKAKALANKKSEFKAVVEEKSKECKKSPNINEGNISTTKVNKEDIKTQKKSSILSKKETKNVSKGENQLLFGKKSNKNIEKDFDKKNKTKFISNDKAEQTTSNLRPSTRSRHLEDFDLFLKNVSSKELVGKASKINVVHENHLLDRSVKAIKKAKEKAMSKVLRKNEIKDCAKKMRDHGTIKENLGELKEKTAEKEPNKVREKKEDLMEKERKEGNTKKRKKSLVEPKPVPKESVNKKAALSTKEAAKDVRIDINESNATTDIKRPVRKCSAAEKLCFDLDGFTSDEDEFLNTLKVTKARAPVFKNAGLNDVKEKPKKENNKKVSNVILPSSTNSKKSKQIEVNEEKNVKEIPKNSETTVKKMKNKDKERVSDLNLRTAKNDDPMKRQETLEMKCKGKKIEVDQNEKNEKSEIFSSQDIVNLECKKSNLKIDKEKETELIILSNTSETTKIGQEKGAIHLSEVIDSKEDNLEILKEDTKLNTVTKNNENIINLPLKEKSTEKKRLSAKEEGDHKSKKCIKGSLEKADKTKKLRGKKNCELLEENLKSSKRTRPVRQCSTKEKKWIETDSDFSFYETSDDEDNLPILGISLKDKKIEKLSSTNVEDESKTKSNKEIEELREKEKKREDLFSDNFSESDDEPLNKKAHIAEKIESKTLKTDAEAGTSVIPMKTHREVPGLHPLKKVPSESQLPINVQTLNPLSKKNQPSSSLQIINEPKSVFYDPKRPELSLNRSQFKDQIQKQGNNNVRNQFLVNNTENSMSEPNKIEMLIHSLKKEKASEMPINLHNEVKVSDSSINYRAEVKVPEIPINYHNEVKVPEIPVNYHSEVKVSDELRGYRNELKITDVPIGYHNDVKVTFGKIPYQSHTSQINQISCNYQVKPIINFPTPREPISTHGLDLLSEVALPTTPKEKFGSQTERIEKWLKDSVEVEQKKTYPAFDNIEYKTDRGKVIPKAGFTKPDSGLSKPALPAANSSSHSEPQKFGQMELLASQKLLKKNIFAGDTKVDVSKTETQPAPLKKALTSVQDLLKLQKEKKEMPKSPKENSPHLKNCKCNNCIVKKGWFKNKPVPKADEQKPLPIEDSDDSTKPFQSLTKAFSKAAEIKNSKMAASVAPIVLTSPPSLAKVSPASNKEGNEKKGIFQQKKLSFLERMKERERKEALSVKLNSNAFSPNNESSVYAFEPEPEKVEGINAPFRSKLRESRTSSASKSEDETSLKISEDETSAATSSGTKVERSISECKSKVSQSTSIAVQVNLDSEINTEVEVTTEVQDGKSIEISTQTEVPEEDSDSPMFYIPLQQATTSGGSVNSTDQQLIQGVALKLGTEGPMGPNQRVVMKAKLVTKPPDTPSIKAVVMPQPKRIFDQKINNPPIGTVQPTTRKPPEEPKTVETKVETPASSNAVLADTVSETQPSKEPEITTENIKSKSSKSSHPIASRLAPKNKEKAKEQASGKDKSEINDEHSPSSSSASSSKSKKGSKQKSSETVINPSNITWLPPAGSASKLVEAPTFHATEKDFQDPFEFFDRIRPVAEKFGLCKIVPPSSFKPDCKVSDDMRFTAYNQYVHRLFHRWGPNIKEMMAIKKYLGTQSISLKQPPWIGGIEVDLPRLYQSVQNCGGLMKVMEKKKWHQVADMMRIPKAAQDRVTKLDDIYCKYLLPYDTLSPDERQKLFDEVEKDWTERQRLIETSDCQGDDDGEEENYIEECEECVVKGRNMALNQFYRIARNTKTMWFKNADPTPRDVENEFWKHVSERNHHVCVHSGSIDSSGWGYGFPIAKNNAFSKHPWNLKVLTNNSSSVLRSLGPVMGVTVPTLHVGMVFTAFCWYRDPHGLPWIEYLHTGAPKIWYGISDDNSSVFQDALRKLIPRFIKNKTIWLPSDTAMIPPAQLVDHGVSLCHTIQEPGQFILVFPRAFISSICTGYLVSESVYFAQPSWLTTAEQAFKDIQESCEPSMFSLEKLLFNIATDSRSSVEVLKQVLPMVWHVRQKEIDRRKTLLNLGLKTCERLPTREIGGKKRKGRWAQDDEGDYECEICRTNLFVSLVTNSHEEGTYCLQHAIDLLTQKRHQLKYCKLMYSYTQEEMNELIEKLEQRIEAKSQKKVQGKSSTTAK